MSKDLELKIIGPIAPAPSREPPLLPVVVSEGASPSMSDDIAALARRHHPGLDLEAPHAGPLDPDTVPLPRFGSAALTGMAVADSALAPSPSREAPSTSAPARHRAPWMLVAAVASALVTVVLVAS